MPDSHSSICYIVSHGFASRMILQTDLLGRLANRGIQLSLISPDAKDPVLSSYCNQYQIKLHSFHSNAWIWKSNYILYRSYFLEDIKSNPALYEKHYYEIHLANHKFKILKFIPYILICFYYIFNTFPQLRILYKRLENLFLNSGEATRLLKSIQPDLLVSTYPVNPQEGILLYNAKKERIQTAIHLLSWDNITSKGHFFSMADHYLAWGPVMQAEFIEKYKIPTEKIFITGVPHFDLHTQTLDTKSFDAVLNKFGLDANKPYIVFGMSSPRFVPGEIDIVEFLAKKINENELGSEMQMLIRPHPQNVKGWMADKSWIERLHEITNDRIKLFLPNLAESKLPWSMEHEDMFILSTLLSSCVVCINSCSTLSIDTLMAGKGNIAPMFDGERELDYWASARRLLDYNHIKKFVAAGGTQVALNYQSLLSEIKNFQKNPHYKIAERRNAIELECGHVLNNSTENVIQTLIHILEINSNTSTTPLSKA